MFLFCLIRIRSFLFILISIEFLACLNNIFSNIGKQTPLTPLRSMRFSALQLLKKIAPLAFSNTGVPVAAFSSAAALHLAPSCAAPRARAVPPSIAAPHPPRLLRKGRQGRHAPLSTSLRRHEGEAYATVVSHQVGHGRRRRYVSSVLGVFRHVASCNPMF